MMGHVIACRITAENPDASFQPTSGGIRELNFRSTPYVWGYFSVGALGGVHEFSDSQFGHLFAFGDNREMARKNMVVALKELSIRGDIRTTVEYLPKILETEDFINNKVDTTWLERTTARREVIPEKPLTHEAVIHGVLFKAHEAYSAASIKFAGCLERGQMPSREMLDELNERTIEIIYDKVKYRFVVRLSGPSSYLLTLRSGAFGPANVLDDSSANPANRRSHSGVPPMAILASKATENTVAADVISLVDGGLLILLGGKKYVVYGQKFPQGLRLTVDGRTCIFSVPLFFPLLLYIDGAFLV